MRSAFLRLRYFVLVLFGGLLIGAFQNCSKATDFRSEAESKAESASDATGAQPYDGKIYVQFGALCPDGKNIISRIVLKNETSGEQTRDKCQDLAVPVSLTDKDFQLDPADVNKIVFNGAAWASESSIDIAAINSVFGFGYWLRQNFGTPGDTPTALTQSKLHVFENGVELGPAHALNSDVQNLGGGRFTHWDYNGAASQALFLSTSDNTDPRMNGRKYTYVIGL